MDLKTRHVEAAGIVREAYERWMIQILRNLTDPVFTAGVRDLLRHAGAKPVRLPRRSPNLYAFIERFIREYMIHYHLERPHQGLDGRLIQPADSHGADGPLVRRERLGGLLNYYYREAG